MSQKIFPIWMFFLLCHLSTEMLQGFMHDRAYDIASQLPYAYQNSPMVLIFAGLIGLASYGLMENPEGEKKWVVVALHLFTIAIWILVIHSYKMRNKAQDIWGNFQVEMDMAAPYLTETEEEAFRVKFRKMETEQDHDKLMEQINKAKNKKK